MDAGMDLKTDHKNCCMFKTKQRNLRKNQHTICTQFPSTEHVLTLESRAYLRNVESVEEKKKCKFLIKAIVPDKVVPNDNGDKTEDSDIEEDPREVRKPRVVYKKGHKLPHSNF